jgi:hypothetical protein
MRGYSPMLKTAAVIIKIIITMMIITIITAAAVAANSKVGSQFQILGGRAGVKG